MAQPFYDSDSPEEDLDVCIWSDCSSDNLKADDDTGSLRSWNSIPDQDHDPINTDGWDYLFEDQDLLETRSILCSVFVNHIWKSPDFLVSSEYKLSSHLDVNHSPVEDTLGLNNNVIILYGPWSNKYGQAPLNIKRHKKWKKRPKRERRETKRRNHLLRTYQKNKTVSGKGRWLPRRTKRMICRYKQCLFRSNDVGSAGGVTASCHSVIIIFGPRNAGTRQYDLAAAVVHLPSSSPGMSSTCIFPQYYVKHNRNSLANEKSHGHSPNQGTHIFDCRSKHTAKNGQCNYRYLLYHGVISVSKDDNEHRDDADNSHGRDIVRTVEESGCETKSESQKTSAKHESLGIPTPGEVPCLTVDITSLSVLSETEVTTLCVVHPSSSSRDSQMGNTGYVRSIVDSGYQNSDDDGYKRVDLQQDQDQNGSDNLTHMEVVANADGLRNGNKDIANGKCLDTDKDRTCVSDSKPEDQAAADCAADEKLVKTNQVRPRLYIPSGNISPEDVENILETLDQSAQAETSTCEKKPEDTKEDNTELDQFFSVDRVPPFQRESVVAMVRTEQGRSPLAQQPIMVQNEFREEFRRLATFFQCSTPDGIFVIPIAKTGFFLTSSPEGKVECAFCRVVVLISLFRGRNAEEVHRELSPRCSFLLGRDVGNVSIAEIAEHAGAKFLHKYPLPTEYTTSAPAVPTNPQATSLPPPRRDPVTEILATDSEPHAAEEPARYSLSLPADKPGSFSALPAVSGSAYPSGCSQSSRARDAAAPQQQQLLRDGRQGAGSGDVGETVADSRPALQAGHGVSTMPYQTATLTPPQPQPQPQLSSSGTEQSSQPNTGNQPATSQTSGLHQTARVEVGPITSLGTAREAAPANTTGGGPEGEERSQTSGSGSGGGEGTENSTDRQLVTYEELGILSQRPKRPDMALVSVRVNTFEGWPHNASHPKDQMAEAGFYYTGHADLVRCFHCKGGLKTWESSDQPWIEHSRWFPRCPFIKLCKGQKFVQAVQKLNDPETRPTITENDVMREIRKMEEEEKRNLSSDVVLLETLPDRNAPADPEGEVLARAGLRIDADITEASMREVAERLADENEELASSTLCKMCQTNEVNVLFLPCGHLVSCAQCAPALRTCAMCRQPVRGSVRVLLDEKPESEEMMQQNQSDGAAAT